MKAINDRLGERSATIVSARRQGTTFVELANRWNVSKARARQIYYQAEKLIKFGKKRDPDSGELRDHRPTSEQPQ